MNIQASAAIDRNGPNGIYSSLFFNINTLIINITIEQTAAIKNDNIVIIIKIPFKIYNKP